MKPIIQLIEQIENSNIIEASDSLVIDIKKLPKVLSTVLMKVGYRESYIPIVVASKVNQDLGMSDYSKNFIAIVNLETNHFDIQFGSMGNMDSERDKNNSVDDSEKVHFIPENGAIIYGTITTRSVVAKLYVNPSTFDKMVSSEKSDVTKRESEILGYFETYTSAGRKRYFPGMGVKQSELDALMQRGFLKKSGSGMAITILGKNVATKPR